MVIVRRIHDWKFILLAVGLLTVGLGVSDLVFLQRPVRGASSPDGRSARVDGSGESALIVPGKRVGPLKVGDTRNQVFAILHFKDGIDRESVRPNCGTEYLWSELKSDHLGNIFVRLQENRVFQIESSTDEFHLATGVKPGDRPNEVQQKYPGLTAYLFTEGTSQALGGRPLIFWVDSNNGLAFLLAAYRGKRSRYVYSVIVFAPNGSFCPNGVPSKESLKPIAPYSVEEPDSAAD